jgi:peptide-methionine (R)-S-oxide reductase
MPDPALDPSTDPKSLDDASWNVLLNPAQFAILRRSATERAWSGPWLDTTAPGTYRCAGCGSILYEGAHKFHSGCGWPSFFQEASPGALRTVVDRSHGMVRTEMRCARCDGHLGHIFDDAPHTPTGLRHCVNGHALVFVPDGADPAEVIRRHRAAS